MVSGEERRDSAVHIHVTILPQTPLHPDCHITPSRVPWGYTVLSEVSQTKEKHRILQSRLLYSPTPSKTLPFLCPAPPTLTGHISPQSDTFHGSPVPTGSSAHYLDSPLKPLVLALSSFSQSCNTAIQPAGTELACLASHRPVGGTSSRKPSWSWAFLS